MMISLLFFIHYFLILLFGVYLSAAFAGIPFTKKNSLICLGFCFLCGVIQLAAYMAFSEDMVWKLYPLISHFPLFLLLSVGYHKKTATAMVSICTAYLFCQPAKWFGVMTFHFTRNSYAEYLARIITLLLVFIVVFFFLSEYMAKLFNKDTRSTLIFGITPVVYYVFDYTLSTYTGLWDAHTDVVVEFLPFFLGIVFLVFCLIYYKEYEQKEDAKRREQIIHLVVEEQKKELEAVKRSEHEIRLIRHDMRLFLANLSVSIEKADMGTAKKMISSYIDAIDATAVKNYCQNATINYTVSAFAERCEKSQIQFQCQIDLEQFACDEILLSTIISNGLDNAIQAQALLPVAERKIYLMLKEMNGKILLSIRNPFDKEPVFKDGLPISSRNGHGYGTQSISYLAERMGGSYQFLTEDRHFILRVIIP